MGVSCEWLYHRNSCNTCARAQEFFSRQKVAVAEVVDARKHRLGPTEALKIARQVDDIYASKGTKVVHLDLRNDRPDDQTIVGLLIGPTGNLRAPTIRYGRTLLVGFNESAYRQVLK